MEPVGFFVFNEFITHLNRIGLSVAKSKLNHPNLEIGEIVIKNYQRMNPIKEFIQDQLLILTESLRNEPPSIPQHRLISFNRIPIFTSVSNYSPDDGLSDYCLPSDYGWDIKFRGVPISCLRTFAYRDKNRDPDENNLLFTPEEIHSFFVFASNRGNLILFSQYESFSNPERDFRRAIVPKKNEEILRLFGKEPYAKIFYRNMKIPAFIEV